LGKREGNLTLREKAQRALTLDCELKRESADWNDSFRSVIGAPTPLPLPSFPLLSVYKKLSLGLGKIMGQEGREGQKKKETCNDEEVVYGISRTDREHVSLSLHFYSH